jgi:queuine tRNA-ribosyltransferase
LDRCNEILGARLNTMHNLYHYQKLMQGLREAIAAGTLEQFVSEFYAKRDLPVPALEHPAVAVDNTETIVTTN